MKHLREHAFEVIVTLFLGLALFLGAASFTCELMDGEPAPSTVGVGAQAVSDYAFRLEDGTGTEIFSITEAGNTDVAGTLNSDGAATFPSLVLDSVTTSGPVRFGTASSVISGTTIAHGIGTTPTVAMLTPQSTGGYTATVYVLATNTTSITIGVQDGITVTTLNWMAGK